MSLPKQKELSLYRGDTTTYRFDVADLTGYSAVNIRFAAKRTDNNQRVIDFNILSTDPGNDWSAGVVQANVTSGMTQGIETNQTLVLRYDLEVTRDDGVSPIVIKTEWFGTIAFTPDITVGNPIITPPTEASIREDLSSTNISKGATLVGVASSIWGAIAINVQEALQWLLDNTVGLPASWTPDRIIKTGAERPDFVYSGLEVDASVNVTGARSVTATVAPTTDSELTRKDYVDAQDNLRVAKVGDTMTGTLTIPDGTIAGHAVNKGQMDTADGVRVLKAGDSMTGDLAMGTNKITGLGNGTNPQDAVTKSQLDAIAGGSGEAATISLNDDETINITAIFGTASDGEYLVFQETDAEVFGTFMFSEGTPSNAKIISGSSNFVSGDIDTNLCLVQSGNDILLKNRLGSTLDFRVYRRGV